MFWRKATFSRTDPVPTLPFLDFPVSLTGKAARDSLPAGKEFCRSIARSPTNWP